MDPAPTGSTTYRRHGRDASSRSSGAIAMGSGRSGFQDIQSARCNRCCICRRWSGSVQLDWINMKPASCLTVRYALSDGIPLRSFYVALIVGTILNLINQGDALFGAASIQWLKVALTYVVPYAVSTYRAVSYRLAQSRKAVPPTSTGC